MDSDQWDGRCHRSGIAMCQSGGAYVLAAHLASSVRHLFLRGLFPLLVDLSFVLVILDGQFLAYLHVLIQRIFLNADRNQLRDLDQGMVR